MTGLGAGIVEVGLMTGGRIDRGKVGALVQIAAVTCQGEILRRIVAQMLRGDNVFDVKCQVVRFLWEAAVFAAVTSSTADQRFCPRIHCQRSTNSRDDLPCP